MRLLRGIPWLLLVLVLVLAAGLVVLALTGNPLVALAAAVLAATLARALLPRWLAARWRSQAADVIRPRTRYRSR